MLETINPANGEEYLDIALQKANEYEQFMLEQYILEQKAQNGTISKHYKPPSQVPLKMLPYPIGNLPEDDDFVRLTDELPENEPDWYESVRDKKKSSIHVQIVHL